jgi:hypothetical protein
MRAGSLFTTIFGFMGAIVNGRSVVCSLPPHPNLLPRGEGTRGGTGARCDGGVYFSSGAQYELCLTGRQGLA